MNNLNLKKRMKMNQMIEYIKIHLVSLEQDLEEISNKMDSLDPNCKDFGDLDFEYNNLSGQIIATAHLLSVAEDMI
jgi:uncharacterized protein YjfI (DUF2170 family)